MAVRRNIFVADDILIKTGYLLLFLALLAGLIIWPLIQSQEVSPTDARIFVLAFLALAVMVIAFLVAGYRIRSQEKKILAVLNILEKALEVSIGDLAENTGLKKETIVKAVHEINRRGMAYFIYDRATGWIYDGRLKSQTIAVNNCPACGHSIGYSIPLFITRLPRCSYCKSPIDVSYINRLKQEKIQSILMANPMPAQSEISNPSSKSGFNWAIFVILLLLFWPLALVYAYAKHGRPG
ncbi:MAG: hypothetical protein LJE65_04365 [Desulfobacteraceae bacterium]|nr:hypothetical protein [Desulfobacteraceae bacterium]